MSRPARAAAATLIAVLTVALLADWKAASGAKPPAAPEAEILVFTNAAIHTGTGDAPIRTGTLVVKRGKIAYVGPHAGMPVEFQVGEPRDLKGAVIIPGLV